jgi:hypothetical protein
MILLFNDAVAAEEVYSVDEALKTKPSAWSLWCLAAGWKAVV